MSKLELMVARWLIVRLLRWPHQPRLCEFFGVMREVVMSEFPEDNRAAAHAFLAEMLEESNKEPA